MAKTIIVFGYGPGISSGVAHKFGKEGFQVAIVGRTQARLDAGVKELEAKGVKAAAFAADVGDPAAARAVIGKVREALGPIHAIHWNAYGTGAGNLLTAKPEEVNQVLGVAIHSLLAAVNASLGDLKAEKGAVLITNGGFGYNDPAIDEMSVKLDAMGLSLANAAKHKLAGMLHQQLKGDGVYVGELVMTGTVKGTAWDNGSNPNTVDPALVGDKFWDLYRARKEWSIKY
jgi:NADP-dependent 3-hydroxy acid dehydrogenase YdfG